MGHGGGKQTEKDRCLSHAQTESTTMEEVDVLTLRIFVVSYPKILVRYYTCKKKTILGNEHEVLKKIQENFNFKEVLSLMMNIQRHGCT